ncbi:hypothetical protein AB1N83_004595 [Pleurotus pulmonarius]
MSATIMSGMTLRKSRLARSYWCFYSWVLCRSVFSDHMKVVIMYNTARWKTILLHYSGHTCPAHPTFKTLPSEVCPFRWQSLREAFHAPLFPHSISQYTSSPRWSSMS